MAVASSININHIRGDDLSIAMALTDPQDSNAAIDITGWTIRSQVRQSGTLVSALTITVTNASGGLFTASATAATTDDWPIDVLDCDVEFTRPTDGVVSSQPFTITVCEDITRDD